MSAPDPLLFVAGSPRSGTTLVRNLIATHPALAVPHESEWVTETAFALARHGRVEDLQLAWLIVVASPTFRRWALDIEAVEADLLRDPPNSYPALVSSLYRSFAIVHGKEVAGDRTPRHALWFDLLGDLFPDSHFIHVVRDPREVAMSLVVQPFFRGGLADAAALWVSTVKRALETAPALGARYRELRYERLVEDPQRELTDLFDFVGLPAFSAGGALIGPSHLESSARGRAAVERGLRDWSDELTKHDVATIEAVAGPLMEQVGYAPITRATALTRAQNMYWRGRRLVLDSVAGNNSRPEEIRRGPPSGGPRRPWAPVSSPASLNP
jgi:hypothetical protein